MIHLKHNIYYSISSSTNICFEKSYNIYSTVISWKEYVEYLKKFKILCVIIVGVVQK
jgi:hypothetical protein